MTAQKSVCSPAARPAGLPWYGLAAAFCGAALIVLSRQPDYIFSPQFYAEDGQVWFAQAYNLGWFHALFIPYAGYLVTFPRLIAGLALLVPFHLAPLIMNVAGLIAQSLPAAFLLSSPCEPLGSLDTRALWAVTYLLLPNTREIHINLTNAQWHIALLTCLVLLSRPAVTKFGKLCEMILLLLCGLTGPFCLGLLIVAGLAYWFRPHPTRLWCLMALCPVSIIQLLIMWNAPSGERAHTLGASVPLFVRLAGGHIYSGAILGANRLASVAPLGFLLVAFCCGTLFLLYTFWVANLEFRLLLFFFVFIGAACLASPVASTGNGKPAWLGLLPAAECRYWFFPMLAFVWSLVWCARNAGLWEVRMAGRVLLAIMILGVIREYRYRPLVDDHFRVWASRFEHAQSGTVWKIPIPFDSRWTVQIRKR